jgi:superfamily II DNA or RNA helicase
LNEQKIKIQWKDETNHGRSIDVKFNGLLRPEQQLAVEELLNHENGVLSATTAFGKTVVGASLIAHRKVNTLIIVHRQQLLSQWIKRLSEFLIIRTMPPPEAPPGKGQKKKKSPLGQLAGGKIQLSSIIDVAMMQSLNRGGKIRECVEDYGMIIVDECHHVPAISFEQILCKAAAKYVYGLTATPMRQNGHHPIIFFHCGPIRFQIDAKDQALKRPFDHYLIPRFTSFKLPIKKDDDRQSTQSNQSTKSIQEIYRELTEDELRNQQIVDDIIDCHEKSKNILVLTGRVAHVDEMAKRLKQKIPHLIALTGGMGARQTQKELKKISQAPMDRPITLISTGKFIGEGFDEPRLDTLFLAMPVAWKGTLHQYAGRLHRLWENKNEVTIYDYVDVHVPVLERMYGKRLKGYAAIGYRAKVENIDASPRDIIFDNLSFLPVYLQDMDHARRDIFIVTPFVTARRVAQMMDCFTPLLARQLPITIVTRPAESFPPRQKDQLTSIFEQLTNAGIMVIFKPAIHQKFAIIDQKIVWYGSINLMGFGNSQESIMRLISANIAQELSRTIPPVQAW